MHESLAAADAAGHEETELFLVAAVAGGALMEVPAASGAERHEE
jgi:hypothetical protein